MALQPRIQFLDLFTQSVGLLRRRISQSQGLYRAHSTAQTQNIRTQTSMPQAGFVLMIPVFVRAKTVERAATVISRLNITYI
jgi:hypothetical protein